MPCRAEASGHKHAYCIITVTNLSIGTKEKRDVSREFPEIDSGITQSAQNKTQNAPLRCGAPCVTEREGRYPSISKGLDPVCRGCISGMYMNRSGNGEMYWNLCEPFVVFGKRGWTGYEGTKGSGEGRTEAGRRIGGGFTEGRPSGLASLPDCFLFDRFAMGTLGLCPKPHKGLCPLTPPGTSPWTLLRFAPV